VSDSVRRWSNSSQMGERVLQWPHFSGRFKKK
jgi:hypothetical protein